MRIEYTPRIRYHASSKSSPLSRTMQLHLSLIWLILWTRSDLPILSSFFSPIDRDRWTNAVYKSAKSRKCRWNVVRFSLSLFFCSFSLSRVSHRSENNVSIVRRYIEYTRRHLHAWQKFVSIRKKISDTLWKASRHNPSTFGISPVSSHPSSSYLTHSHLHSSARTKRHERSCRSTPITSGNTPLFNTLHT